jgi:hypothetical protein
VSGYCVGVVTQDGTEQVAVITKPVTLIGGFSPSNWMASYPITQETTLDAASAGRVLLVRAVPAQVANLTIARGYTATGDGGGIFAGDALTLTQPRLVTNGAGISGGGAAVLGVLTLEGGRFENNAAVGAVGGGLSAGSLRAISNQFLNSFGGAPSVATLDFSTARWYMTAAGFHRHAGDDGPNLWRTALAIAAAPRQSCHVTGDFPTPRSRGVAGCIR